VQSRVEEEEEGKGDGTTGKRTCKQVFFSFSPAVSDSVLRVFSLPWFVTESKERETERETERDRERIETFNSLHYFLDLC